MSDEKIVNKILEALNSTDEPITSIQLAESLNIEHQSAVGAVKSILTQASATTDSFLKITAEEFKRLELTPEGKQVLLNGSHEARIFRTVVASQPDGIDHHLLARSLPDASKAKVAIAKAISNGWIRIDRDTKKVYPRVSEIQDSIHDYISSISKLSIGQDPQLDSEIVGELKRRRLISESTVRYLILEKGRDFSLTIGGHETDVTANLLLLGDRKDRKVGGYNFNALGIPADRGHLDPFLKELEKQIDERAKLEERAESYRNDLELLRSEVMAWRTKCAEAEAQRDDFLQKYRETQASIDRAEVERKAKHDKEMLQQSLNFSSCSSMVGGCQMPLPPPPPDERALDELLAAVQFEQSTGYANNNAHSRSLVDGHYGRHMDPRRSSDSSRS